MNYKIFESMCNGDVAIPTTRSQCIVDSSLVAGYSVKLMDKSTQELLDQLSNYPNLYGVFTTSTEKHIQLNAKQVALVYEISYRLLRQNKMKNAIITLCNK